MVEIEELKKIDENALRDLLYQWFGIDTDLNKIDMIWYYYDELVYAVGKEMK